jgi:hypothetical protein
MGVSESTSRRCGKARKRSMMRLMMASVLPPK